LPARSRRYSRMTTAQIAGGLAPRWNRSAPTRNCRPPSEAGGTRCPTPSFLTMLGATTQPVKVRHQPPARRLRTFILSHQMRHSGSIESGSIEKDLCRMIEHDLATSVPSLSGTLPRRHRHDGGRNTSVTAATPNSFASAMNESKGSLCRAGDGHRAGRMP
jgi:hypothetical protein